MIEGRIDRRKVAVLAGLVLLAGCKIIPKAPPEAPPAPPADNLPNDQQRHRIALLVPTTGPNGELGQSIANATTMALLDTQAKAIRITIYDTAPGPAAAANAALKDGNKLILGPLASADVPAIATVARAARVPLITYSNDSTIAARDVFTFGTAPETAIARVVQFAGDRGVNRFALLAPKGDYGTRAGAAYQAAVKAAGGTIVASESYDRSNTSVLSAAQRLKAKGGFDAVLIADSPRFAALAAPRLKKAGAILPRILGTELWVGDGTLGQTAALRGAWFAGLSDARYAQFSTSYKARFGDAPYRQATFGYDSVLLAVRISREWRPGSAFPTAKLLDRDGFLGLDGPFRFAASGQGERGLEVREVRSGGLTIVGPAPERFVP